MEAFLNTQVGKILTKNSETDEFKYDLWPFQMSLLPSRLDVVLEVTAKRLNTNNSQEFRSDNQFVALTRFDF